MQVHDRQLIWEHKCMYFSMGVCMLVGERERDVGQLTENVKVKSTQSGRHSQIIKAKTLPLFS